MSDAATSRPGLLARWPILRRLPLLALVAGAAWIVSESHGEHIMLRYRLARDPAVTGLKAQITREGHLVRSAEWRYTRGTPDEQLQEIELQPGDYVVSAQAQGRKRPDPAPLRFHVDHDGSHEAFVDLQ